MTVTHYTSHSFSYLSSLPLVTDPIPVASNNCAIDRLHKDRCAQAFGRNTLSKPHNGTLTHNHDRQKLMLHAWKTLTSLLSDTNRSTMAWLCSPVSQDELEPFLSQQPVSCFPFERCFSNIAVHQDIHLLSEIYGELPSPTINPTTFLSGTDPRMQKALHHALYWESPPGMRLLYPYQQRTVTWMLKQELDPGVTPDLLYIPIHGVEGSDVVFYLQPSTMEVLRECPMRSQVKGGILCKEMGMGKTCIILGLIMATKYQLLSPEEPMWDKAERPILTPLAFQHFPTPQFQCAREVAHVKDRPTTFPSLVEILIHFIRASPELIDAPGFNDLRSKRAMRNNDIKVLNKQDFCLEIMLCKN